MLLDRALQNAQAQIVTLQNQLQAAQGGAGRSFVDNDNAWGHSAGRAPQPPAYQPAPAAVAGTSYDTSYCRQYTKTTNIGGQNYQSTGTACRQADGTWREVN